jgi:hypothetical protein
MSAAPLLLKRPQFFALDSLHIGAVASDTAAKDRTRQQRTQDFEKAGDCGD